MCVYTYMYIYAYVHKNLATRSGGLQEDQQDKDHWTVGSGEGDSLFTDRPFCFS